MSKSESSGGLTEVITSKMLREAGHPVLLPVWMKVIDFFREEHKVVVEWTSPHYQRTEISILWGAFSIRTEKGERKTFEIRGKKAFCETVVKQLSKDGNVVSKVSGEIFKDTKSGV